MITRKGLLENWIPVWPQLDEDFGGTEKRFRDEEHPYIEFDISSLRYYPRERADLRKIKVGYLLNSLDMYLHKDEE